MPDYGTWIRNRHGYLVLIWNKNKHKRTTLHPSDGFTGMQLNNKKFESFYSMLTETSKCVQRKQEFLEESSNQTSEEALWCLSGKGS